jgi:hypothetical protein
MKFGIPAAVLQMDPSVTGKSCILVCGIGHYDGSQTYQLTYLFN